MNNENNFIQQLLKSYINQGNKEDLVSFIPELFSHESLIEKIFSHGLEGLTYYELHRLGLLSNLPETFTGKVKWGARNTLGVNLILINEFKKILKECKSSNINIIPVKGIVFLHELYENFSLRPMADMDFFVESNSYKKAIELFRSFGFLENCFLPARKWERENFRIALTRETPIPITVELHQGFSHPGRFNLSIDDAMQNLRNIIIGDQEITTFNNEFTLLFLIHHLGMHYFNIKLIWVVDIVKFLYKYDFNWDKINRYVEKYKLRTVYYMTLNLLKPYVSNKKLPDLLFSPGGVKKMYLNLFFSHNSLNYFRYPQMNVRLAQILCEIPLIDSWADRWKFLKSYIMIRFKDYL